MQVDACIMHPVTAPRCRVCRHPERDAIERACSASDLVDVATAYGLTEGALERHVERHAAPPVSGIRRIDLEDDAAPVTLRSPGQVAA